MPQDTLSDADVKALEATLNRFDPAHLRDVLDEVGVPPAPGDRATPTASGPLDFGSVPAGVLVYRSEEGALRLRLTITEMTGASYEEFELSDAHFKTLVDAAVARLQRSSP